MPAISLSIPKARRDTRLLYAYASALVCAAAALVTVLIASGFGISEFGSAWPLVGFGILALLTEHQSVRVSDTVEVSVSFLPMLFVAVIFGPLAAALLGALTMATQLRRPYVRWLIWTGNRTLLNGMTGLAAHGVLSTQNGAVARIVLATAVATLVNFSLDIVLNSVTLAIRGTGNAPDLVRTTAPIAAAGVPLYTSIVGLIAYAYMEITPWTAGLFFVPALAAQRLFVLYREQQETSRHLARANQQLEQANISFATALVATLDARDRYTAGHSASVAIYARDVAKRMGLSEREQRLVHVCGLVHDIGKIGLPAGLLEKQGPLTLEERREMEQHPVIGERILAKVEDYSEIATIVRHHHERIDGEGYPDKLPGESIPLLSRIIAVADAYDAMTSDRPYRDAMPSRVARLRLAQGVEGQFDTAIVAAFEAILAGADESYRSGRAASFSLEAQEQGVIELRTAGAA